MKMILGLILLTSLNARAESFFGPGYCAIESLPCKNGQSVSCSAQGPYGGYCIAESDSNTYRVVCVANGGGMVTRACARK